MTEGPEGPEGRDPMPDAATEANQDRKIDLGTIVEHAAGRPARGDRSVVFDVDNLAVDYGEHRAVRDVTMKIYKQQVTALIGPSGCGKTTVLRCFNRMNDLIRSARVSGQILYHGQDLYEDEVNVTEVRRRIGMVFQKPNPFPKSIFD